MERLDGETDTPAGGETAYTGSGESPYASDLEAHYTYADGETAYTRMFTRKHSLISIN